MVEVKQVQRLHNYLVTRGRYVNIKEGYLIISVDEKQEFKDGDEVYNSDTKKVFTFSSEDYLQGQTYEFLFKVLAIPENIPLTISFSISQGEIKPEDILFIEVEQKYIEPPPEIHCNLGRDGYFVKLDSLNNINIIPTEITWDYVSADIKRFCDEKGYTDKPAFIVMPFILKFLEDKYEIKSL